MFRVTPLRAGAAAAQEAHAAAGDSQTEQAEDSREIAAIVTNAEFVELLLRDGKALRYRYASDVYARCKVLCGHVVCFRLDDSQGKPEEEVVVPSIDEFGIVSGVAGTNGGRLCAAEANALSHSRQFCRLAGASLRRAVEPGPPSERRKW